MEQPITREALVASVRAAIRSLTRTPIRIDWPSDPRFFIEVRIPKFAEQLELSLLAQMLTTGLGGAERLTTIMRNAVVRFRLPLEREDGKIVCAVFNAEPVEGFESVELTPDDIFPSEESDYMASNVLAILVFDALLTAQGRTRTIAQATETITDLFQTTGQTPTSVLDQRND